MKTEREYNDHEFEEQAIRAIHHRLALTDSALHLVQLVKDQEAAAQPAHRALTAAARRRQADFERDGQILGQQISLATEANTHQWSATRTLDPGVLQLPSRDRLHAFGADRAGTGGPFVYKLAWGLIEGGTGGAGIGVRTNLRDGTFSASHFVHGSIQLSSYAGLGVRLTPSLPWCRLSVRPFVNWSGFDILSHRIFDSQLNPTGLGVAGARIGLHVQSWDHAGGAFNDDGENWVTVWQRSETNPSGQRNYNDSVDARSLQLEVFASSARQYAIWVSCQAFVITQVAFGLDIWASASVSCELPYLFVEELNV